MSFIRDVGYGSGSTIVLAEYPKLLAIVKSFTVEAAVSHPEMRELYPTLRDDDEVALITLDVQPAVLQAEHGPILGMTGSCPFSVAEGPVAIRQKVPIERTRSRGRGARDRRCAIGEAVSSRA